MAAFALPRGLSGPTFPAFSPPRPATLGLLQHVESVQTAREALGRLQRDAASAGFRHPLHWARPARPSQQSQGALWRRNPRSRAPAAVAEAQEETQQLGTVPVMGVNLMKNIIGATVLSLASGVAACSDLPGAVAPGCFLVVLCGAALGYTFALVARNCELLGVRSYRESWEKTLGPKTAWLVSICSLIMAGSGCLQYIMVLSEAGSSLAALAGLPSLLATRSGAMLAIVGTILLPMSFLDNLNQLKFTSVAGIFGVFYYVFAMFWRYITGAYAPGGQFYKLLLPAVQPSFSVTGGSMLSPPVLTLLGMLTSAYICHYNAPKYYQELKDRSMRRFYLTVLLGFGGSTLIYLVGFTSSFLTFGGHSSSFIFNNYASTDGLFVAARAIMSFVIICTYPLLFVGLCQGALELLPGGPGVGAEAQKRKRNMTFGLVAGLTAMALSTKDIGLVIALPGAVTGSMLAYVFPALIHLKATAAEAAKAPRLGLRLQRSLSRVLVLLGCATAVLGAASALKVF
ncbi:unnamed protein product [Polarella glacialis]|uniref:Amino acid transporter transmembrane domain-containing protein n=1 Tax=Polarella glacialis TaxID=89957 RepID=A0A813FZD2_POLGL|nr:unnamed protein product [Polarella glacialis]